MDTQEFAESSYVTVQLVKDSKTKKLVILGEGGPVEVEYSGKKSTKLELPVEIDGKKKTYTPNKDTIKNIQSVCGNDSKNWVGKVIQLQLISINGKEVAVGTVTK